MDELSHGMRTLVDAIGMPATLALARAYAGRALYVPRKLDGRHPIALCVGYAPARSLSQLCGGRTLYLPPERTLLAERRNAEIVRRVLDEHATVRATADAFGVSRRWVQRVVERSGRRMHAPINARAVEHS